MQRLYVRDEVRGMVPRMLVRVLAEHVAARGVAPAEVMPAEVMPAQARRPADDHLDRYPAEQYCQWLLRAAERLQDPLLGLHLGQSIRPSHLGALGYVLLSCETLGAALLRIQRYHRLLNDLNPVEHRLADGQLALVWGVAHGRPGALFDEHGLTAIVTFARHLCRQSVPLTAVDFVNPPPPDPGPFVAYFGCPVRWSQPATRLAMPQSCLQIPLAQADPALEHLMAQRVDAALALLPAQGDLADMTRRVVANLARQGMPELEQVAAALRLSPRVFYRRLAAQGLGFRDLRDATLRHLAETHLADPRLSMTDVAHLLGYAEPSAFSRAFRRWTGSSPLRWRQRSADRG